jgi:manganese/zinc/iron transport system permease protein
MFFRNRTLMVVQILWWSFAAGVLFAEPALAGSLANDQFQLPAWEELLRVLLLQDYNTRVVIVGTALLGLAAGLVGTFLLLRKRALLSDTLSHATLPGIALMFIIVSMAGGEGKNLLLLIVGAAVFSVLGMAAVIIIQRTTRLKDDAALGIVLSVSFGLGIALLGIATRMETGNAAGLSSFIYGKTASMLLFDALLIGLTALLAAIFCIVFFKEFTVICFDSDYAASQGWPVVRLDFLMMTLVVIVTVIGLQAVGLILVVALLIIPPAAARFWTHRLRVMLLISGIFGALSGMLGAGISALMANLPAGAVIVLTASLIFILSLVFGASSGLVKIMLERRRLRIKITRENILRGIYEYLEISCVTEPASETLMVPASAPISFSRLMKLRSWSAGHLMRGLRRLCAEGLVTREQDANYRLTTAGLKAAARVTRKHRLWEVYLIAHADIATGQVDWGADEIEHVLDNDMIAKLEKMLPASEPTPMPHSPHSLKQLKETA